MTFHVFLGELELVQTKQSEVVTFRFKCDHMTMVLSLLLYIKFAGTLCGNYSIMFHQRRTPPKPRAVVRMTYFPAYFDERNVSPALVL